MNNTIIKKKNNLIMKVVDKKRKHSADAMQTEEMVNVLTQRFLDKGKIHYACLFIIGINTGSRISDILKYRMCDILKDNGEIEEEIIMIEQKTGKERTIYYNEACKLAFKIILKDKKYLDEWLFVSRGNRKKYINTLDGRQIQLPLTRQSVWEYFKSFTKDMDGNFSTHTMRQTFSYFFVQTDAHDKYVDGRNVTALTLALRHSSPNVTMRYMKIRDVELKNIYKGLNLGLEVLEKYCEENNIK